MRNNLTDCVRFSFGQSLDVLGSWIFDQIIIHIFYFIRSNNTNIGYIYVSIRTKPCHTDDCIAHKWKFISKQSFYNYPTPIGYDLSHSWSSSSEFNTIRSKWTVLLIFSYYFYFFLKLNRYGTTLVLYGVVLAKWLNNFSAFFLEWKKLLLF